MPRPILRPHTSPRQLFNSSRSLERHYQIGTQAYQTKIEADLQETEDYLQYLYSHNLSIERAPD